MGNNFLPRIQGEGRDHVKEDMGASICNKRGHETYALQV